MASDSSTTAPIPVNTAIARLQSIGTKRTLTGTVEPIETVTLTSRVMGLIRQLPVQEGDRVQAGETIAVIDVAAIQARSRGRSLPKLGDRHCHRGGLVGHLLGLA